MDLVLIGAGGHGKVVLDIVQCEGKHRVVGFLDADSSLHGTTVASVPVLGGINHLLKLKAQKVRALIKQDFRKAFESCDVILTPTAPSAAFGIGETTDPLAMYLNDVFAVPASLAGLPAMSVPGGLDGQGLPLGLHLIGRELDEQTVLNAGLAIDERAGFSARPDKWW